MKSIYLILSLFMITQINAQDQNMIIQGDILTISSNQFTYDDSIKYDVTLHQNNGSTIDLAAVPVTYSDTNHFNLTVTQDAAVFINTVAFDVKPRLEADVLNGVSTLDLVQTMRHILGVQPFDELYQIIAGDLNSNNGITAADIVFNRRLILQQITEIPGNDGWKFIYRDYYIENNDQLENFSFQPIPPFAFDSGVLNYENIDLFVIKVGDVNNSFAP